MWCGCVHGVGRVDMCGCEMCGEGMHSGCGMREE